MRITRRKRILITGIALALLSVFLVTTSVFQQWLLRRAETFAANRGFPFAAERLHLEWIKLRISLFGFSYNQTDQKLRIEHLRVDFPWSALRGGNLRITDIEANGIAINIRSSATPRSTTEFHLSSYASRIQIDHLAMRNVSIVYSTPSGSLQAPSLSLETTNGHGILRLDAPVSIGEVTTISAGAAPLELDANSARFGPAEWRVRYTKYEGSGSARGVVRWFPELAVETEVSTNPLTIDHWKNIRANAKASYRDGVWEVPDFRITREQGTISGSARVSNTGTSANVSWSNLSLDPLGFQASVDGTLGMKWLADDMSDVSAVGQVRMKSRQYGDFETGVRIANRKATLDIRGRTTELALRAQIDTRLEKILAGDFSELRGMVRGNIQPLSEASKPYIGTIDISASAILRNDILDLREIRAQSGGSAISGASIQISLKSQRVRGKIPFARIALHDFVPDITGVADLNADIEGTLKQPAATFSCTSAELVVGGVPVNKINLTGAYVGNSPGIGEVRGTVTGTVHPFASQHPYATGDLFEGFESVDFSAGVHMLDDLLSLQEIHASSNASDVENANLELNLSNRRIVGSLPQARVDLRDVAKNVLGTLNLDADINGTIDQPAGSFSGTTSGMDFGNTHIDDADWSGTFTKESIRLTRLEANQSDGHLQAEGFMDLTSETIHATADISNLKINQVADLSALLFVKAEADGNYRNPNIHFEGDLRNVVYRHEDHGNIQVEGTTDLKEASVSLDSEKYSASVKGIVTIASPYPFSAKLKSSQSPIHYDKLDGTANGLIELSGDAQPFLVRQLTFDNFTLRGEGIEVSANGPMETGARVDIKSDLTKIPVEGFTLAGTAEGHATLSGTPYNPMVEGSLTTDHATLRSKKLKEPVILSAAMDFTGPEFSIRDAHATFADATATITGRGSWKGNSQLQFRVSNIRPEKLAPGRSISGIASIEGELDIRKPALEDISGTVHFTEFEMNVRDAIIRQKEPIEADLNNRVVTLRHFEIEGPETHANLSGFANLGDRTLQIDADADTDLTVLEPLIPDLHPAGRIRTRLALRGTLQNPSFDGFVNISDGELSLERPDMHLDAVNIEAKLIGNRIEISHAEGEMNDGKFAAEGGASFSSAGLRDAAFEVSVERGQLEYPEGLQSEFSTQLKINGSTPNLTLSGTVDILSASYEKDFKLTQEVLSRITTPRTNPALPVTSGFGDQIRLEIEVRAPGTLLVKNNLADLEATGAFRVRGTASNPIVLGRASVLDGGELYFGPPVSSSQSSAQTGSRSDRYSIERGSIDFNNPARTEPYLDFEAKHELNVKDEQYLITLNISGTLETLKAELTSDPYLEQSDIVAMLLTGRSYEELQGNYASYAGELALGYVTGQLSDRLLTQAGSVVGLSSVSIEPVTVANQTDLAARLNVARTITKGFSLIYSQNLNGAQSQTWVASYSPRKDLIVRGVNDASENSIRAEMKQILRFGGPTVTAKPAATVSEPKLRDVTFTGTLLPYRELLRQVAKKGNPYGSYRVSQDIRKLRRYLASQGYPRARIQSQQNVQGQKVDIRFEIVEGPRIRLEYEGASVPASLQKEILQVWMRRSSDASAMTETSKRLLRYFRSEDDLQVQIVAGSPPQTTDDRHYVFRIDPGVKFETPKWLFIGAEPMEITEPAGSVMESPETWRDRIETYYRGQGYLDAKSTVPKLVIDKDKAHFEVTVDRGAAYTLASIEFEGNMKFDAAHLREVVEKGTSTHHPVSPMLFTSAWLDAARQSITNEYWRNGFNDVQVVPSVSSDAATSRTTVRFAISEGEPQIIESIEVSGAVKTRPSYIQRQIQFKDGDPVDYAKINLTRKNLYDTRVFKHVEIEVAPGKIGYDARIRLSENPPWDVRYGLGIIHQLQTGEQRVGLEADLAYTNLFGRGITAGVTSKLDSLERDLNIFASQPQFRGRDATTTLTLFRTRDLSDPEQLADYLGVTIQQKWILRNHYVFSYDYSYRHVRTNTDQTIGPQISPFLTDSFLDNPKIPIARINATISRETRNDLLNATHGAFFSNSFEIAPPGIGSSLIFLRNYTQYFFLHPFRKRLVSASAVRFGLVRSLDNGPVDSTLQFQAGGSTTVRAFKQDQLTPFPGNYVLILNQEVRYPLFWKLSGAAFIDAGQVTDQVQNLWHLRFGPGAGIRILVPIVLRTDFGINVRPRPGESRVRWSFGIGQIF